MSIINIINIIIINLMMMLTTNESLHDLVIYTFEMKTQQAFQRYISNVIIIVLVVLPQLFLANASPTP